MYYYFTRVSRISRVSRSVSVSVAASATSSATMPPSHVMCIVSLSACRLPLFTLTVATPPTRQGGVMVVCKAPTFALIGQATQKKHTHTRTNKPLTHRTPNAHTHTQFIKLLRCSFLSHITLAQRASGNQRTPSHVKVIKTIAMIFLLRCLARECACVCVFVYRCPRYRCISSMIYGGGLLCVIRLPLNRPPSPSGALSLRFFFFFCCEGEL